MLQAIEGASTTITFETFVFKDQIAGTFCSALAAAAKRGVKVHVLLDWLGSKGADPAWLAVYVSASLFPDATRTLASAAGRPRRFMAIC